MPMLTYTRDIPDAPNNPSVDQGPMKTNTNSIDTLIAIDHHSFADSDAGTHKLVTMPTNTTPAASTGLGTAIYTAPGTADVGATSQLFYQTSNADLQLSAVRAWAIFNGTTGNINGSQSKNVVGPVTRNSAGDYTVTLTANAVAAGNNNFAILITCENNNTAARIGSYAVISPGVFRITVRNGGGSAQDATSISFMVLQI